MMLERPKYSQLLPRSSWDGSDTFERDATESAPIIDFGYVFRVVRRRIKLILVFAILAAVVGAVIVATSAPIYNASAQLIIEKRTIDALQQESVFATSSLNPAEADGQLQVISSDELTGRVVQTLNLLRDPEFTEEPKGIAQTVSDWLVDTASRFDGLREYLAWFRREPRVLFESDQLQAAIERIQRNLQVRRIGLTYVFSVRVSWSSPGVAARIANAIVDTYIDDRLRQRSNEAEAASSWFDERLAELRQKAEDAEAAVANFREENNIVEAGREGLLNEQQLANLNAELAKATTASQAALEQLTRITQVSAVDIASAPIGSSADEVVLNGLRANLIALQQEEAGASNKFGADHPVSVDLRNQIGRLNERTASEVARLKSMFQGNYDLAKAYEAQLQTRLQELTTQSTAVGNAQVKLKALESEASVYRSLYDDYLQRYLQTLQQQSFPSADARVISAAVPPEFDNISGRTIFAIALAIGASLGLGAAFFRERMDRSIRTPWQLRLVSGAPTLGILPLLGKTPEKSILRVVAQSDLTTSEVPTFREMHIADRRYSVVLSDPFSRFTETIRRIKVAVDAVGHNKPCCIVGFISDEALETRGIVATNYARLLSSSGRKTLLIDLDLRNVTLTRALTPETPVGLIDLSAPGAAVHGHTAIWHDEASHLDFLPACSLDDTNEMATGLVSSDRLVRILVQLAANYESIVLDLPPLAISSDAAALANMVAAFVLVSEWGKTSGDALAEHLSESGIPPEKLLGTVLGEVDMAQYRKYERVD